MTVAQGLHAAAHLNCCRKSSSSGTSGGAATASHHSFFHPAENGSHARRRSAQTPGGHAAGSPSAAGAADEETADEEAAAAPPSSALAAAGGRLSASSLAQMLSAAVKATGTEAAWQPAERRSALMTTVEMTCGTGCRPEVNDAQDGMLGYSCSYLGHQDEYLIGLSRMLVEGLQGCTSRVRTHTVDRGCRAGLGSGVSFYQGGPCPRRGAE